MNRRQLEILAFIRDFTARNPFPPTLQDDCKVGGEGLKRGRIEERLEGVDMEAAESLFKWLEQVPDPGRAKGVRHPFQATLRLTLLALRQAQDAVRPPWPTSPFSPGCTGRR